MVARLKELREAMTKSQMFSEIAEHTALSKRDVASVFDALETVIERHVLNRPGFSGELIS